MIIDIAGALWRSKERKIHELTSELFIAGGG